MLGERLFFQDSIFLARHLILSVERIKIDLKKKNRETTEKAKKVQFYRMSSVTFT